MGDGCSRCLHRRPGRRAAQRGTNLSESQWPTVFQGYFGRRFPSAAPAAVRTRGRSAAAGHAAKRCRRGRPGQRQAGQAVRQDGEHALSNLNRFESDVLPVDMATVRDVDVAREGARAADRRAGKNKIRKKSNGAGQESSMGTVPKRQPIDIWRERRDSNPRPPA